MYSVGNKNNNISRHTSKTLLTQLFQTRISIFRSILWLFTLVGGILLTIQNFQNARFNLQILEILLYNQPELLEPLYAYLYNETTFDHPRANWYLGLIAGQLGEFESQQKHFTEYLSSGQTDALIFVHANSPQNTELAKITIQFFPEHLGSWFWLGESYRKEGLNSEAFFAYSEVVAIDPTHWASWCWLGFLQRDHDLNNSLISYTECCYHGNNAANGCFHAGRTAERIGNFEKALYFYLQIDSDDAERIQREIEISQTYDE